VHVCRHGKCVDTGHGWCPPASSDRHRFEGDGEGISVGLIVGIIFIILVIVIGIIVLVIWLASGFSSVAEVQLVATTTTTTYAPRSTRSTNTDIYNEDD
jgi:hypothetical protein